MHNVRKIKKKIFFLGGGGCAAPQTLLAPAALVFILSYTLYSTFRRLCAAVCTQLHTVSKYEEELKVFVTVNVVNANSFHTTLLDYLTSNCIACSLTIMLMLMIMQKVYWIYWKRVGPAAREVVRMLQYSCPLSTAVLELDSEGSSDECRRGRRDEQTDAQRGLDSRSTLASYLD